MVKLESAQIRALVSSLGCHPQNSGGTPCSPDPGDSASTSSMVPEGRTSCLSDSSSSKSPPPGTSPIPTNPYGGSTANRGNGTSGSTRCHSQASGHGGPPQSKATSFRGKENGCDVTAHHPTSYHNDVMCAFHDVDCDYDPDMAQDYPYATKAKVPKTFLKKRAGAKAVKAFESCQHPGQVKS